MNVSSLSSLALPSVDANAPIPGLAKLDAVRSLREGRDNSAVAAAADPAKVADARKVKDAFGDFMGNAFYGQMLKALRSSQGKTPYFNGGKAEEMFRGQLDQALVDKMSDATADRFAEPLFAQQFPDAAAVLSAAAKNEGAPTAVNPTLSDLSGLRRR